MLKYRLMMACLLITLIWPIAQAQEALPDVGWMTAQGDVWIAGQDIAPQRIAQGVDYALFSPQATRLILRNAQTLAVVDLASEEHIPIESLPAAKVPINLVWQDETAFWFNVVDISAAIPIVTWDLWRVSLNPLNIEQVSLQGQAFPAPDGSQIAIIHPGTYGQSAGLISIVDADFNTLASLEFPAVSSGSNVGYIPSVGWHNDALRIALPPPDVVYQAPGESEQTRLIELNTDGQSKTLDNIHAMFYPPLLWSPDGTQIAYTTREEDSYHLIWQSLDTQESQTILTDQGDSPQAIYWESDLIYMHKSKIFMWRDGQSIHLPTQSSIFSLAFARNGALVMETETGLLIGDVLILENIDSIDRLILGVRP